MFIQESGGLGLTLCICPCTTILEMLLKSIKRRTPKATTQFLQSLVRLHIRHQHKTQNSQPRTYQNKYDIAEALDLIYKVLAIHIIPALLHHIHHVLGVVRPRVSGTAEPVCEGGDKSMSEKREGPVREVTIGEL